MSNGFLLEFDSKTPTFGPVELDALRRVLRKLSALVEASPEIKELDLNPLAGYAAGVFVLATRLVLQC